MVVGTPVAIQGGGSVKSRGVYERNTARFGTVPSCCCVAPRLQLGFKARGVSRLIFRDEGHEAAFAHSVLAPRTCSQTAVSGCDRGAAGGPCSMFARRGPMGPEQRLGWG